MCSTHDGRMTFTEAYQNQPNLTDYLRMLTRVRAMCEQLAIDIPVPQASCGWNGGAERAFEENLVSLKRSAHRALSSIDSAEREIRLSAADLSIGPGNV